MAAALEEAMTIDSAGADRYLPPAAAAKIVTG